MAGGFTLDVVGKRKDQLRRFAALDPRAKRREVEIIRADSVDGGQFAVKHVIGAAIRTAALDRDEVGHVLHHTDDGAVPPFVGADRTVLRLREVAAALAAPHRAGGLFEGGHERRQLRGLLNEQVQRNALRRAVP